MFPIMCKIMRFFSSLKYLFICAFILVTGGTVIAEDDDSITWHYIGFQQADSLKQLLDNDLLTEKQILALLLEISGRYHAFELDSSIVYAEKGIPLAKKLHDDNMLMEFYRLKAVAHAFKGDFDTALADFKKMEELADKLKNQKAKVHAIAMTGFTYMQQGSYNTAIDYYLKALKMYEMLENYDNIIAVLGNLSEMNRRLGNTEIAIQYLKQAEVVGSQLPNTSYTYTYRMPQIFNEYAYLYIINGGYDEALRYAMKADSLAKEDMTLNKCESKFLLARIYLHWQDYDRALQYARESYQRADILKDVSLYLKAGKVLSDILLAQGKYREAEIEALRAWQIDSTHLEASRGIAENIAKANIYMGDKEKAAYFFQKYAELNALYTEKSFHTTVSDLAIRYETNKKEELISSLEKERQMYIWLGMAGVLLTASLWVIFRQKLRNARRQHQLIAAESIQEGEIGERERIANDLHDRLGGSLSAVKIELNNEAGLQNIGDKIDACMKEIREVTNNIMPRTLRLFGLKEALEDLSAQFPHVQFHFFGDAQRFKRNLEYIVFCCAKELVNNAQKHSGAAHINVQLVQNRKYLTLTVQDDGCGFDEKTVTKGDGLQNIRNRIASCRGKLDIISAPGKGTEAVIELRVES